MRGRAREKRGGAVGGKGRSGGVEGKEKTTSPMNKPIEPQCSCLHNSDIRVRHVSPVATHTTRNERDRERGGARKGEGEEEREGWKSRGKGGEVRGWERTPRSRTQLSEQASTLLL